MGSIYDQANFQNIVLTILGCVVLVVVGGCIYTFIRSIFLFIFSGAKEENKKKGWNSIRFMIIGVLLTMMLLFLVPTVLRLMNVPKYDVYTPKNIFNKAGSVVTYLFTLGNVLKQSQKESEFRGDLYYNTTPDVQQPSSNGYQL